MEVPSGKAMTASGTLVASIGTISGRSSIVTVTGFTPTLVNESYNINLLVIIARSASKTITLPNPIENQNIFVRARMTGGTSVTIQVNGASPTNEIIYSLGSATATSTTSLSSITSSLHLFSDGTNWSKLIIIIKYLEMQKYHRLILLFRNNI